jgi:PAS domain S-box-containing protein
MTPRYKNRKGFFINIVLPSALTVLLFTGTLFVIVIPGVERAMMERKREMIMQLTHAAKSILAKYHTDETEGLLSRQEAQTTAISRLRYLRYGEENKDYFWITTKASVMLMHPYRPELEQLDLTNYRDPLGNQLFEEAARVASAEGSGYIHYMWQWKDDSTHIVSKLSYVELFEPWGWIIGTGIYIEDVRTEIANLSRKFVLISIIITLITASILFYVGRQSFRIERRRIKAEEDLHESREKYRSLVEASTEGMMMVSDGAITFVNAILQQMTGMEELALLGQSPGMILQLPDELALQLKLEPGKINATVLETYLVTQGEGVLEVILNVSPVTFYGKEAVILSVKDLSTDMLDRASQLKEHERFSETLDRLGIGLFRATLDQRGRIIDANQAAVKMLGYKNMEELSEAYILELFADMEDRKGFRQELMEMGFLKNQMLKLTRQNGQNLVAICSMVVGGDERQGMYCDGIMEEMAISRHEPVMNDALTSEYIRVAGGFLNRVKTLMQPNVSVTIHDTIDKVWQVMVDDNTSCVLVLSESDLPVGIIERSDLIHRISQGESYQHLKAYQVMTAPVISVSGDQSIAEALMRMKHHSIETLMVKDVNDAITGMFSLPSVVQLLHTMPPMARLHLRGANSPKTLGTVRNELIAGLLPVIHAIHDPAPVFQALGSLSDEITQHLITGTLKEMGAPPTDFCFISLGSDARGEQTLSTDQDNALIFKDLPGDGNEAARKWFLKFSQRICAGLNDAGYQYCKGEVMAMNPAWCQPLSVWQEYFNRWIKKGTSKDLLDINIFFDIRPVYGDADLAATLQQTIFQLTRQNPAYLYHLTQNTLLLKPQVGFWGNILLETAGAPPETVNIKESIMPLVNFARIYALRDQLGAAGTLERIAQLRKSHTLKESSADNITEAFIYLNRMRLQHQAWLIARNLKPDNLINTRNLSDLDKTIIKKVISHINNMLARLSYDFKGSL